MNEEEVKAGLQEKAIRLKITSPIDVVESYIPTMFKAYDVVVIDSIQTADRLPSDFSQLKRQYPKCSDIVF
jgi:hypothetical protein